MRYLLLLASLALVACVGLPTANGPRPDCAPLVQRDGGRDPGIPSPPPFSYTVGPPPASPEAGTAEGTVDGGKFRFQAGIVGLDFTSPVERAAVEPLMYDFGLELVEMTPIPVMVPSGAPAPSAAPATASRLYRMRIRDLAAVKLETMSADALATNFRGAYTFAGPGAAAVFAVVLRINRHGGCYPPLRAAFPNTYLTPG